MMTSDRQNDDRPHVLRRLAIVVCFFALFLGILTPWARSLGAQGLIKPQLLLLVVAPWTLGVLILLFDRKSPLKFWAAPLLLSLIAPALAFGHTWIVIEGWFHTRTVPNLRETLVISIALIGTFALYARSMCPIRCPECRRWAMIPLRSLWGRAARTPTTSWCSSCGAKYWRARGGEWRVERRRTWLEASRDATEKGSPSRERHLGPKSRVVAPVNSGSGIETLAANPDGGTHRGDDGKD